MSKKSASARLLRQLGLAGLLLLSLGSGCHEEHGECLGSPGVVYYIQQYGRTCHPGICEVSLRGDGCDDVLLHARACHAELDKTTVGAQVGIPLADGGAPDADTCDYWQVEARLSHEASCTASVRLADGRVLTLGVHASETQACGIEAAGDDGRIVFNPP